MTNLTIDFVAAPASEIRNAYENYYGEGGQNSADLDTLISEMAEERNYLLGLGWESEFTRMRES